MTPKSARKWKRQLASDLNLPTKTTRLQKTLLSAILHFDQEAKAATTMQARPTSLIRQERLIRLLTTRHIRGFRRRRS